MTSRNINVNIVAKTGRYSSGLKKAMAETKSFDKSLGGLANKAAKLGSAAVVGGVVALGVAMAAVGIKGAKAFMQFEETMSRIEGLVGVSHEAVVAFGDDVKEIAHETAVGSQELAEALFFITSAGLEGQEALDTLESSAKASAAGLGDVVTIADLLTSAVNAYGSEVISSAEATDVLVATVREGKAAAPELASAMGRVIPIASQMGIGFDQVGAAIAAMTRVGLDANEATTALRSIMTSLLNPTTDAARALEEVGLSAGGIRATMAGPGGLLEGLVQINTAFDGQADATTRVFGNVRALTGVLSLMGSNLEDTRDIFDEVAASAGTAGDAFDVAAATSAFAFKQAKVDIENALLGIGEQIMPDIAAALEEVGPLIPDLVTAIGDLTIAFIDLASSAVPAATEVIKFATEAPEVFKQGMFGFASGVDAFNNIFDTMLGPNININDFINDFDRDMNMLSKVMSEVRSGLDSGFLRDDAHALATAIGTLGMEGGITAAQMNGLQDAFHATDIEMGIALQRVSDVAEGLGITEAEMQHLMVAFGFYTEAVNENAAEVEQANEVTRLLGASERWLAQQAADASSVIEDSGPVFTEYGEAVAAAMAEVNGLANAILELSSPSLKAINAVEKMQTAEESLNDVLADTKATTEDVAQAQLDFAVAIFEAQGALDGVDANSVNGAMQILQDALGLSDDEARDLLETLGLLDGTDVNSTVTVTHRNQFDDFDRGPGGARAHGGPVSAGGSFLVGEQGPEIFTPNASGRIIPNDQLGSNAGGRTVQVTITGNEIAESIDLSQAVQTGLLMAGITEEVEFLGSTTVR